MAKHTDPTGYDAALATIEPGSLSERQQRVAVALAMIRDGASILSTSKACGVPYSTLHGYHKHVTRLDSQEGDGMTLAMGDLQKGVMTASLIATERVVERLVDPEHEWRDGDLVKAQGVNVDKLLALRNTPQGAESSGVSAFVKLLESASVTITKRDAAADAIDVTPEHDGD